MRLCVIFHDWDIPNILQSLPNLKCTTRNGKTNKMDDNQIKDILKNSKTIAMIGVSSEKKGEDRKNLKRKPANVVMKYMQDFGYKVIPVNPFSKGEIINGETVVDDIENISIPIDIVDVFRPSNEAPAIAEKAKKIGFKVLGFQIEMLIEKQKKCQKVQI